MATADEFAGLARELESSHTEPETVQSVCELARVLLGGDHAAFTTLRNGRFRTVATTSDVPVQVDQLQYDLVEGPCIDAIEEEEAFRSVDLAVDERYPRFGPKVAANVGIRSMLSHRLFIEADTFGALNLYAAREGAFDETSQRMGSVFATHAALALKSARVGDRARNLDIALESNRRIGTAVGILMARNQWTERHSFETLRRYSQDHNARLAGIAERVILTGELGLP
jgi:GAF domain-containing protein